MKTSAQDFLNVIMCYSSEDMPLLRLHGSELTVDYFDQNGFDTPIMVDKKDGLDLKVPPPNFSIQDVELYVGECNLNLLMILVQGWRI